MEAIWPNALVEESDLAVQMAASGKSANLPEMNFLQLMPPRPLFCAAANLLAETPDEPLNMTHVLRCFLRGDAEQ